MNIKRFEYTFLKKEKSIICVSKIDLTNIIIKISAVNKLKIINFSINSNKIIY